MSKIYVSKVNSLCSEYYGADDEGGSLIASVINITTTETLIGVENFNSIDFVCRYNHDGNNGGDTLYLWYYDSDGHRSTFTPREICCTDWGSGMGGNNPFIPISLQLPSNIKWLGFYSGSTHVSIQILSVGLKSPISQYSSLFDSVNNGPLAYVNTSIVSGTLTTTNSLGTQNFNISANQSYTMINRSSPSIYGGTVSLTLSGQANIRVYRWTGISWHLAGSSLNTSSYPSISYHIYTPIKFEIY